MNRTTAWGLFYGVAAVIFFGGYFLGIQQSRYFTLFALFGIAYAVGGMIYLWRTHSR